MNILIVVPKKCWHFHSVCSSGESYIAVQRVIIHAAGVHRRTVRWTKYRAVDPTERHLRLKMYISWTLRQTCCIIGNGREMDNFKLHFELIFIKVKFELVNWRWYWDHCYTWRHSFMCLHIQFIAQTTVNTYLHQTSDWSGEVCSIQPWADDFSLPLQSFIIWTRRTSDSFIPESLPSFLLSE